MSDERPIAGWYAPTDDSVVLTGDGGLVVKMFRPDGTVLVEMGVQARQAVYGIQVIGMSESEFLGTEKP